MANENILSTGRDSAGRFVSKADLMAEANKQVASANAATSKVQAQLQKMRGAYGALQKQLNGIFQTQSKGWKAAEKQFTRSFQQQAKSVTRFYREMEKQRRADQRLAAKLHKQELAQFKRLANEKLKAARAGSGRGASGGIGLGQLAGIVSVAAVVAASRKLSDYVTGTAWSRERARALGGDMNVVGKRRDAELYSKFADQGLANQYSSPQAIQGLLALRDTLQHKLGEQGGTDLTLKLTESLKSSRQELQQFLAMASVNVPQALEAFRSSAPAEFREAIKAATQETDELGKTAFTIEQAYRDLQDVLQDVTMSFLNMYGGDVRAAIQGVTGQVVDGINTFRDWFSDMQGQWGWLIDAINTANEALNWFFGGIKKTFKYAYETGLGGKLGLGGIVGERQKVVDQYDSMINAQLNAVKMLKTRGVDATAAQAELNRLLKERNRINEENVDVFADDKRPDKKFKLPDFTGYSRSTDRYQQSVTKTTMSIQEAIAAAENWWKTLKLTPVEKATLDIDDMNKELDETAARVKRDMSRLSMLESSPLGFGQSMKATLTTVQSMNTELDLLQKKLEAQNAIVAENEKHGRIGREDRIKALEIETQINERMSERNRLLGSMSQGYLDAITAQAFGAGKFEKFLITADRNLGKGIERNLVRKNALLGTVGADALGPSVSPFQFQPNMDANLREAADWERRLRQRFAGQIPQNMPMISTPGVAQDIAASSGLPQSAMTPQRSTTSSGSSSGSAGTVRGGKAWDLLAESARLGAQASKLEAQAAQMMKAEYANERSFQPIVRAS